MRPDPDATPEGKTQRLEKDLGALSTIVGEQEREIARLRRDAIVASDSLWYKLGRRLGLVRDIRPSERHPPGVGP